MDNFGFGLLPKTKFRHLTRKKNDSKNLYEFKKDNIRVYVQFIRPNFIVILGGRKKNQDKDISKAMSILSDYENE